MPPRGKISFLTILIADHQDWLAEQHIAAIAGLRPSAPVTKKLALLLAELDQRPTTLTHHPDRFQRHLNFLLRLLDSHLAAIEDRHAKETQVEPESHALKPASTASHPFADKVDHGGGQGETHGDISLRALGMSPPPNSFAVQQPRSEATQKLGMAFISS